MDKRAFIIVCIVCHVILWWAAYVFGRVQAERNYDYNMESYELLLEQYEYALNGDSAALDSIDIIYYKRFND